MFFGFRLTDTFRDFHRCCRNSQSQDVTEITAARALQGYVPLREEDTGIPKKYSENFVDYFPPNKTE